MNPPLRTAADVEGVHRGRRRRHDRLPRDRPRPAPGGGKGARVPLRPFGIIGLECALPLYVKALVEPGTSLDALIEMMTSRAREIVKLDKGTLRDGADADVTIIDPHREVDDRRRAVRQQEPQLPYNGWKAQGAGHNDHRGGRGDVVVGSLSCSRRESRRLSCSRRGL
jgi:dihydroorotase